MGAAFHRRRHHFLAGIAEVVIHGLCAHDSPGTAHRIIDHRDRGASTPGLWQHHLDFQCLYRPAPSISILRSIYTGVPAL